MYNYGQSPQIGLPIETAYVIVHPNLPELDTINLLPEEPVDPKRCINCCIGCFSFILKRLVRRVIIILLTFVIGLIIATIKDAKKS